MKFWFCGNRIFHWLLHFVPSFENQFLLFVIVKNKLTSVFYASVLLLMINFVITLSKFVVDPLACGSWIYNTLTMLWRNLSSIRGQTHKKTDVNLLNSSVMSSYGPPLAVSVQYHKGVGGGDSFKTVVKTTQLALLLRDFCGWYFVSLCFAVFLLQDWWNV